MCTCWGRLINPRCPRHGAREHIQTSRRFFLLGALAAPLMRDVRPPLRLKLENLRFELNGVTWAGGIDWGVGQGVLYYAMIPLPELRP